MCWNKFATVRGLVMHANKYNTPVAHENTRKKSIIATGIQPKNILEARETEVDCGWY